MNLKVIILAGGSGSRLWPYSRSHFPKQVLKLSGDKSLIQRTVLRFNNELDLKNFQVVTNKDQKHLIEKELKEISYFHDDLVIEEPIAKNTAAAICLAALNCKPDDIMIVLPSDHIIQNEDYFRNLIEQGANVANEGFLVTIGIKPKYPETGYGYIHSGKSIDFQDTNEVLEFVEKPNLTNAKRMLKDGDYLWNSGMFIWKASTILEEFKLHKPQIHDGIKKYLNSKDIKYFKEIENISVDYAILEESKKVVVMESELDWSDLGSWRSVYDISEKDKDANVLNGNCVSLDNKNVLIHNTGTDRTVAVVGMQDVSVIDTDDAVIICDLNNTQDVKRVVENLKEKKSETISFHKTVFRPWGYFKVLEDTDYFKSKRLVIYPEQSISLQYHKHRNETWTIVKGTATVQRAEENIELSVGQTVYIPAGYLHRITNNSSIDVELIEVQTGTYFGEDDIIRIEDQYKRD